MLKTVYSNFSVFKARGDYPASLAPGALKWGMFFQRLFYAKNSVSAELL